MRICNNFSNLWPLAVRITKVLCWNFKRRKGKKIMVQELFRINAMPDLLTMNLNRNFFIHCSWLKCRLKFWQILRNILIWINPGESWVSDPAPLFFLLFERWKENFAWSAAKSHAKVFSRIFLSRAFKYFMPKVWIRKLELRLIIRLSLKRIV